MARMVVIEHKDGRRFAVTPHDFTSQKINDDGQTYEDAGFKIQGWEDGEPYEAPKRASEAKS